MAAVETKTGPGQDVADQAQCPSPTTNRPRGQSSLSKRMRSVTQSFEESNPPGGFSAATGDMASTIYSQAASKQPSWKVATDTSGPVRDNSVQGGSVASTAGEPAGAAPFSNGYHFPPKHSFGQSTKEGLVAFWKFSATPFGFCLTIYGLNIVAWGGMLFLLLCNAGEHSPLPPFAVHPWSVRQLKVLSEL